MDAFFVKAGLIAIVSVIIYIIKKINDYYCYKRSIRIGDRGVYESDGIIYKAARAFAQGVDFNEVRQILENYLDFDEEDIEEVLSLAYSHRTDEDGGYRAFIEAVNKVLGEDIYLSK